MLCQLNQRSLLQQHKRRNSCLPCRSLAAVTFPDNFLSPIGSEASLPAEPVELLDQVTGVHVLLSCENDCGIALPISRVSQAYRVHHVGRKLRRRLIPFIGGDGGVIKFNV